MPYFNRFDICEAWYLYLSEYHGGMGSDEYARLSRLTTKFNPRLSLDYSSLTANGKEIHLDLLHKAGPKFAVIPRRDARGSLGTVFYVDLGYNVRCAVRAYSLEDALEEAIDYADDTKQCGVFSPVEYRVDSEGNPTHLEEDEDGAWVVGHTSLANWDYTKGTPCLPNDQWYACEYDETANDYFNRLLDGHWEDCDDYE